MRRLISFMIIIFFSLLNKISAAEDRHESYYSEYAAQVVSADPRDWPMYNHDPFGSRWNPAEHALRPDTVRALRVKWSFATPSPVTATPVVADRTIYAGDSQGNFYALNDQGSLLWRATTDGPVQASALVTNRLVIFGTISGTIYGLDRRNGAIVWRLHPDSHPWANIQGSGTMVGHLVAFGVASNEEVAAASVPGYVCCSSRGSVVLLDPRNGAIVWQTFFVSDAERARGASGASVWSTPTYDAGAQRIYVTTGNNFSQPTTALSDAVVALDARTGAIVWSNQLTPNDEWTYNFPYSEENPDADFGDSPQIYRLRNGRKVIGAGQKTGFYHVLDAENGQLLNQIQVEPGGQLGGLFADSAIVGDVVFANGINWPDLNTDPSNPFPTPRAGDLVAFSSDGSRELWRFTTPYSPNLAGVAVAAGVVYFLSAFNGNFYALDARSGTKLAELPIGAGISGPSVSRGQVYVGTGNIFVGTTAPGSITALGL